MTALGIAALALLFAWLFGGFLLRLGGLLLVFVGAIGLAVSGNANGIPVATIGAVLWLLGHGHYALRHGVWKGHLAMALWSSAGLTLGYLVASGLHRSEVRRDQRLLAGAETREVQGQA
jgi:hypothetical protein